MQSVLHLRLSRGTQSAANVSFTTRIPQESDQSCTPKYCRQTQNPPSVTFVSILAASAPSSEDFDQPEYYKPSSISLTPEDTSILIGD